MPRDFQIATLDGFIQDGYTYNRNDIVLKRKSNGLRDIFLNIENRDYYEQKVFIELRFFQGEWFLNVDKGVPYYEFIFVKNPDFGQVDSILRDTIVNTEGINTILSYDSVYLPIDRSYRIKFRAKTDDDEIINYDLEI